MPTVTDVTGVAGAIPVGNWNNHGAVAGTNSGDGGGPTTGDNGSVTGLIDDSAANTGAVYTWAFNNYWGSGSGSTTQDNVLFGGYADTDGAGGNNSGISTMQVSSLPSQYTGGGYSVYVYLGGDSNHGGAIEITGMDNIANTQSKYLIQNDNSMRFGDVLVESTATTEGDATLANYVVLEGFTGDTIELSFNDLSGGRARPLGFQITAVPEPSTFALAAFGVAGVVLLAAFRLRGAGRRQGDQ